MEISIIGCGGNSKVVIDICRMNGYIIKGLYDDRYPDIKVGYRGYKVLGNVMDVDNKGYVINSIGDEKTREEIYYKLEDNGIKWMNCIHPYSYIEDTCEIGYGNIICNGVIINGNSKIGNFNLVNTNVIIEHDCYVGNFNNISPRCTICGECYIGNYNMIGVGANIIQSIMIGDDIVVGAGGVVINELVDSGTYVGIPCKKIKYIN